MCNSSEIIVTLEPQPMDTNISFWSITPQSGPQPLNVTIDGFLFRNGIEENQPDSAIVDDEHVYFQVWNGTDWAVAQDIITAYDASRGYHGHIYATFTFNGFPAGPWRCRLTYNGNASKGLTGC